MISIPAISDSMNPQVALLGGNMAIGPGCIIGCCIIGGGGHINSGGGPANIGSGGGAAYIGAGCGAYIGAGCGAAG